jgi:hypothetical protein
MIAPSDAMQVMLITQACHHRTAPRMDDHEATIATAKIWAELFNEFRLELPDLIAAVKKRALTHADAPEPAEIITFAREIRRDRDARRGPTPDYEQLCESKSDDAAELAANRDRLAALITPLAAAKAPR